MQVLMGLPKGNVAQIQKLSHLRPLRQRERGYRPGLHWRNRDQMWKVVPRKGHQLLWKFNGYNGWLYGSACMGVLSCRVALTGFTQPQASCNAQRPRLFSDSVWVDGWRRKYEVLRQIYTKAHRPTTTLGRVTIARQWRTPSSKRSKKHNDRVSGLPGGINVVFYDGPRRVI